MDSHSFVKYGTELLRYVTSYHENIRDRDVFPDVKPGYLSELIADKAPDQPQAWENVFQDIEKVIMPGVFHHQSPRRFSWWTLATSYPSMLGEILTNGMSVLGVTWETCPMSVELEMMMMDWLAQMLHLPSFFLFSQPGMGGGMMQANASEATLTCLLAARTLTFRRLQKGQNDVTLGQVMDKLVAYRSDQAHSSVEKAAMISGVRMRALETDDKGSLRGVTLEAAILEDKANGLIPIFCCATSGSVGTCAFDNLREVGSVCEDHSLWMHVDAAYAGSAFICPEFRHFMDGLEFATSFNFNAHKWLKINYECSPLWVKNTDYLCNNFVVEPLYLKQHIGGETMPEFQHWQVSATSHPCRALKVWFVLRLFGLQGLQESIRHDVQMAQELAGLIRCDDRFEIIGDVILGLVCFRLKGPRHLSEALLRQVYQGRQIHLVPSVMKGVYFLRLAICGPHIQSSDVTFAWDVIRETADVILAAADGHLKNGDVIVMNGSKK